MEPDPALLNCDACGRSFQFGPHRYDGKAIPTYGITVCTPCWDANWDGWAPHLEKKVTAKLLAEGKPLPSRNSKQRLPRE
ncbi:hypothetical protein OI25_7272 [Paraburkholderia fungorum]|jgi:hypothetical protein|uniref:Uncharacterized protein n=1 Tax=Paraburkholderia fungorum TaxID=134537 RepID=A0AAU8SSG2_9BURK|nr:hypothetical protein OI25_7272 [Paraburkholderia fungorum]